MTSQTATPMAKLGDLDKATGVPKPEFHNSEFFATCYSSSSAVTRFLRESLAVSVGLALLKSQQLVRISYSAWASWCTAPKRARGPCNLICKLKMVEYHFWNGTLFDEQVNGGTMDTRNTTLSPEP